jgi:hypothetical protein
MLVAWLYGAIAIGGVDLLEGVGVVLRLSCVSTCVCVCVCVHACGRMLMVCMRTKAFAAYHAPTLEKLVSFKALSPAPPRRACPKCMHEHT